MAKVCDVMIRQSEERQRSWVQGPSLYGHPIYNMTTWNRFNRNRSRVEMHEWTEVS